jgi:septal ring factor EnvC (AmiA/AmiB activator)
MVDAVDGTPGELSMHAMRNSVGPMHAVETMSVSMPVPTHEPSAPRRRWFVRIAMFAALGAGIGWLIGSQVQADAQYGRAHTALSETRQQKVTVLSELAAVKENLRLVNGQVEQTNRALTNDTAQLREVESALANAQSNVSSQQSTIAALHSCLGGVEQSLNALSVGDEDSADNALVAVSADCTSAVTADG